VTGPNPARIGRWPVRSTSIAARGACPTWLPRMPWMRILPLPTSRRGGSSRQFSKSGELATIARPIYNDNSRFPRTTEPPCQPSPPSPPPRCR
jgi:hypothetical protein